MPENPAACAFSVKQPNAAIIPAIAAIHTTAFFFRNIFKVLADGQRREILMMLKDGRLNAGEISEKLQITPAALSYHLKLLKGVDLISEYKEKNFIYYEINTTVFDELIIWVNQFGGKK